jgi:hypothetical protein
MAMLPQSTDDDLARATHRPEEVASSQKNRTLALTPKLACIVVALVAAAFRFGSGLDFGLPLKFDPDEYTFVKPALRMVTRRDLNPHWFGHPGSTIIYINAAIYAVLKNVGYHLGWFENTKAFKTYFANDPTLLLLIPRIFSAFVGALCAPLVFVLTRRSYPGVWPAFFAAALVASSGLHVEYSQLVRTDILTGALILIVAHFSCKIAQEDNLSNYIYSGIFTGIAVATKYPALLAAMMIATGHAWRVKRPWQEGQKLFISAAAGIATLFLCSPYLFIDFDSTLTGLRKESVHRHLSATGGGFWQNLGWYIRYPLTKCFGWLGLGLATIGIYFTSRVRRAPQLIFISFIAVFLIAIATLHLRWDRWILPLIPFVAILSAGGIVEVSKRVRHLGHGISAPIVSGILGLMVLAPIVHATVSQSMIRAGTDTRFAAREWILEHIPAGSRLMIERNGPQIPAYRYEIYRDGGAELVLARQGKFSQYVPAGHVGEIDSIERMMAFDIDYVVLSNFNHRFKSKPRRYRTILDNYEALLAKSETVAEFLPVTGRDADPLRSNVEGGPTVRILKIPKSASMMCEEPKQR